MSKQEQAPEVVNVAAGTVLFKQGQPGGSMYVIHDGKVRITKTFNGRKRVVATLGAGEFFGEMAVVSGRPRSGTAEVIADAKLIKLSASKLEEMVSTKNEIAFRLIRRLADRLEHSNRLIDTLMHEDEHAQVISALKNEVEFAQGATEGLSSGALAGRLSLPNDQVEAVLRRLVRVGVIVMDEGIVRIDDADRLEAFYEFVQEQHKADNA